MQFLKLEEYVKSIVIHKKNNLKSILGMTQVLFAIGFVIGQFEFDLLSGSLDSPL